MQVTKALWYLFSYFWSYAFLFNPLPLPLCQNQRFFFFSSEFCFIVLQRTSFCIYISLLLFFKVTLKFICINSCFVLFFSFLSFSFLWIIIPLHFLKPYLMMKAFKALKFTLRTILAPRVVAHWSKIFSFSSPFKWFVILVLISLIQRLFTSVLISKYLWILKSFHYVKFYWMIGEYDT